MSKTIIVGTLHLACGHTVTPPTPVNPDGRPRMELDSIEDGDFPTLFQCPTCHQYREARYDQ